MVLGDWGNEETGRRLKNQQHAGSSLEEEQGPDSNKRQRARATQERYGKEKMKTRRWRKGNEQ
ncbi:hypothetical protein CRG98_045966 [Punica granatum]|uniref:Uncharacterized protein n=1 Tax=Punica granatum TaxID=22663 RepID=A0A2I0HPY1_PUNGR|nr:hypothetical protein CRG98_045966 [Punica granatum]